MNVTIYDEVKNIVENRIGRPINRTDEMSQLELDSIEYVELIVQIENHFGIEFSIDKLVPQGLGSFNKFVLLIENLLDTSEQNI